MRETIWTQYREGGAALTALTARNITVLGVEWDISACTDDWKASLAQELALVSNPVLPLAPPPGSQFKKESAKLLTQLSKLSFEELKEVTLNLDVAPAKPPPPSRPAAPPSRPPPPATRPPLPKQEESMENKPPPKPAGPPPRPKPPPARPPPPPAKPPSPAPEPEKEPAPAQVKTGEEQPVTKSGGGFSDLFSAPPDPDLATDIPLSLSSDSLATAGSGEATPAPTKPPLPLATDSDTPDLDRRGSVDSGHSVPAPLTSQPQEVTYKAAAPPAAQPSEDSESETSDDSEEESDSDQSGASTPTNQADKPPPAPPSRPAPPPTSRPPPPGPPPRVPGRPGGGPPPVPRR